MNLVQLQEKLSHEILELDVIERKTMEDLRNLREDIKESGDMASCEITSEEFRMLLDRYKNMKIKLSHTLDRITSGNYGLCAECEGEISLRRLQFDPTTQLCLDCKSEREENFRL